MTPFTLHDLRCFDAVAQGGGFQAAAARLGRSHPAVFAAVARLEAQLGLLLLDRSGYRIELTEAGRAFHERARRALAEVADLQAFGARLAAGEEPVLRVVIGDLCPPGALARLSAFFRLHAPATRLHLQYEAVGGPLERLLAGDADLVLHRAESDVRVELIRLGRVALAPVAAPGFLVDIDGAAATVHDLARYTQCVVRDTAQRTPPESHFLIEGAHQCSAPDQLTKREIILEGLAWGRLPTFLVESDLKAGRLLPLLPGRLPEHEVELAAVRVADRPHGPVAARLWKWLQDELGGADVAPSEAP